MEISVRKSTTATPRKSPAKRAPRRAAAKKSVDTIAVASTELERAIARVKPFACTDESLPAINAVALQLRNRILTLVATDRFTLGANIIHPVFLEDDMSLPDDFEVVIRLVELPILLGALKRCNSKALNRVELQIADGQVIVDGVRIGDASLSGKYPKWRQIIENAEREATAAPEFGEVAMNPAYLRRFAAIKPRPVMRVSTPSKPVIATSDDFVGVLMPVRMTGSRADVLSQLGISVTQDKTAGAA
ncbi:DNA polymerase III sliding clamp [Gordonia phage Bosnia]|uniref:DNA polymerase III sliding clamp n=1 Tax=Gordonia phage Bosnia TaxID=2776839 RepID=A0A7L8ZDA4_9CAUD|nr:RusA-like Holliday junction resolvase [Gordonia phage Bosnia]QOI66879.1 DNA polymerase III sliding clamp [Gordonia phage Bosnia]